MPQNQGQNQPNQYFFKKNQIKQKGSQRGKNNKGKSGNK